MLLTFETVTPLLLDGFRHPQSGQLRANSVVGNLRFWLRALCGYDYRAADEAVFGSRTNPSSVRVRSFQSVLSDKKPQLDDAVLYLTCGLQRYRIVAPGSKFHLHLSLKGEERVKRLFLCSLKALSLFGGLGARRRRGFGAVTVKLNESNLLSCSSVDSVVESIASLLKESASVAAEFSSCSGEKKDEKKEETLPSVSFANKETEIYISNTVFSSPMEALSYAARLLKNWRQYTRTREAQKDHDLVYRYARTGEIDNVPCRAIFGLPHHYFLRKLGENEQASVAFEPAGSNRRITRRASPILLSIIPFSDSKAVALFSLFRSQFLPRSVPIQVHGSRIRNDEKTRLPMKIIGRHPSYLTVLSFTDMLISSGEFSSLNMAIERRDGG
ncbi:MAG: type III-B CRISPR module RAMP protein Cmr1 [Planctomycetota bacterium]|nr:type III-B CRISPR module RAMP protein Cmr1 [Planctomycetota bacterium]